MICCVGALAGIGLTALIGLLAFGRDASLPYLVAPMGASAVLIFAVPASPLAQPWSVIGGNTLGALVGIAVSGAVHDPLIASGLAVSLAIAGMSFARCLHPPGGAAALTAVLGGPAVLAAGYKFALLPVAANSAALVALGWLFHKLSRHSYPHVPATAAAHPHGTNDPAPETRIGFNAADVDAALEDIGETFDIAREDLDTLLRRIELRSFARRLGDPRCDDVMSRDLITIDEHSQLISAHALMLKHAIRTLPVVDRRGRLLGALGLRELGQPSKRVADVMVDALTSVPDAPAFDLVTKLSDGKRHAVIVIDADRRPIGMITQTDLLAAVAYHS
jgi:CBS domain-containing membrane protein